MKIEVHGKCILAGEHAVVRGREALVAPLLSRKLTLTVGEGPLVIAEGPFAEALGLVAEKAAALGFPLSGSLQVESQIPPRAGLGSSAALAAAVALHLQPEDPFPLALELENLFHGNSSGIDLAAALSPVPVRFRKGAKPVALEPAWKPNFFLSDSGLRSSTRSCVEKVAALRRPDLDDKMEAAVQSMKSALLLEGDLPGLALAMEEAAEVFRSWSLVPDAVEQQIGRLKAEGALAAKPTGSGDGGFLLSLWKNSPPRELGLIPIWDS